VYKAELARKRSECNGLAESLRRAKRELELAQSKLADQSTELSVATGRIAALEEDGASQVHSSDCFENRVVRWEWEVSRYLSVSRVG